jgi:hypothetical protein
MKMKYNAKVTISRSKESQILDMSCSFESNQKDAEAAQVTASIQEAILSNVILFNIFPWMYLVYTFFLVKLVLYSLQRNGTNYLDDLCECL